MIASIYVGFVVGLLALLLALTGVYRIISQLYMPLPSRWRLYNGSLRICVSAILLTIFNTFFSPHLILIWSVFALIFAVVAELYTTIFTDD